MFHITFHFTTLHIAIQAHSDTPKLQLKITMEHFNFLFIRR